MFNTEWLNYKEYRLTHIVCLNALAIARAEIFTVAVTKQHGKVDYNFIYKCVKRLKGIEWGAEGPLKYLKGISGARMLVSDILAAALHNAESLTSFHYGVSMFLIRLKPYKGGT
ncbi:hypothetical protein ACE3MS_26220 [Paenibacillus dendritiformis]|uniref:hypothetical protein n=1 Tax=Paenibacillus dendritiformis TaxID=130049 RepID=UPI003648105A